MSSIAVPFAPFGPLAARTGAPVRLAMQRLWLGGSILAAGAHLAVQHIFRSEEEQPLEVIYSFGLPRDAALRAFRITGEGFEVHSELRPTLEAVRLYERGIAAGSLASLARTYGDGVVNLTVGNIRPHETVTVHLELLAGVELRDDGFRFRFPFTLAPAYHAKMRAAVVAGEGEMELPSDEFGDVILPRYRPDAASLHEVGFDLTVLHQLPLDEIGSPSHAIRVKGDRVALSPERDLPDRDLVLDVRYAAAAVQVLAGPADGERRPFAAIVPSTVFGSARIEPRRLAIVLDRSGSMDGPPMAQARKALEACLAALDEADSFALLAFDDHVDVMHPALLPATAENRRKARAFLAQVTPRGGTELAQGIAQAVRLLGGAGDALVFTDGQVSGTEKILAEARAAQVRLFCLGIGSASQDRFLALLARETGGGSRFVTPRERVDHAAVDLFASIGRPVATGLRVDGGEAAPEIAPAVFGAPLLIFGETPAGARAVELFWEGGRLPLPLPAGDAETGRTVRLLQGARLITDWESRYPHAEALASLERRKQNRVAARLAELSAAYGLASREMSLVAVVKRAGDRPGELPETRVVAVGMPQDTDFGSYFAAVKSGPRVPLQAMAALPAAIPPAFPPPSAPEMEPPRASGRKFPSALFSRALPRATRPPAAPPDDGLMDLAALLQPDGGMPGADDETRAARTVAAILAFAAAGHTASTGTFRRHVARLLRFLETSAAAAAWLDRARAAASQGAAPPGDWLQLAQKAGLRWGQLPA